MNMGILGEQSDSISLKKSERLEDLQCANLRIIQDANLYCFTSDSVILANFVKTASKNTAVEIGTGCAVVSILVQAKNEVKKIYAFEIQPEMANLAKRNVELNGLNKKIEVIEDDIKNWQKHLDESVDVVFCNPPYFKTTNFKQPSVKKLAKEEVNLTCEQLCKCASSMLKDGGSFFVCYAAERAIELCCTLQKNNLAVKEMFFTENGKGEVKLVFLKATKGGKFGVKICPNLVTNEENGDYLDKLKTKNYL